MTKFSKDATAAGFVIMGVSGSGKTTIGRALARELDATFIEGDDFHSAANIEKMSSGRPLTDEDREGWLRALQAEIGAASAAATVFVLSCSALKRRYRDVLREAGPMLRFVHLEGSASVISERLSARQDHYMPPSLLDSQLAALEPLERDEDGLTLDVRQAPAQLIAKIVAVA